MLRITRSRIIALLTASAALTGPALVGVGSTPKASAATNPINHIVVMMQENRSADHYLGQLHFEGQPGYQPEPPGASNPNPLDPLAPPIKAYHETRYCEPADLDHSWNGSHTEWDNGAMDGFTKANVNSADPTGSRTMGYFDKTDLPFYYGLDNTFATSDTYFDSVLSQTFPNRFYELAGTSFGHIANDLPTSDPVNGFSQKTIFENLDAKGISWKVYFSQIPFAAEFSYVRNHAAGHLFPISQYYVDAATGQLPQVSYVDPIFVASANTETDEHPPSNIQVGEKFTAGVVKALMKSPNWSSSALFLTYDENGGFYDHVPPPAAVTPDDIPPMLQPGDAPGAFDHLGFRVPVSVVSPYSKPHYVSHITYDHTSTLKFIETRFGLPPLTRRDAAAADMTDFFDFSHAAFATPPKLPRAPINLVQYLACLTAPPNTGV
ncbi:MAG: alkaline phosphatase family protein [Acidimicrobiia bacterium]|nr:alkaline phosphatase family protein [Acidimicrobiia bacterium]